MLSLSQIQSRKAFPPLPFLRAFPDVTQFLTKTVPAHIFRGFNPVHFTLHILVTKTTHRISKNSLIFPSTRFSQNEPPHLSPHPIMTKKTFISIFALSASLANAQVLVQYDFESSTSPFDASFTASGITASAVTGGITTTRTTAGAFAGVASITANPNDAPDVTPDTGTPGEYLTGTNFNTTGDPVESDYLNAAQIAVNEGYAISDGSYFQFGLSSANPFSVGNISFALGEAGQYTQVTVFLRSSDDGYTNTLGRLSQLDPSEGSTSIVFNSYNLAVNLTGLTDTDFRLYYYVDSPDGEVFLDNLAVSAVPAIPEPSTYALLSGIFSLGFIFLRRLA